MSLNVLAFLLKDCEKSTNDNHISHKLGTIIQFATVQVLCVLVQTNEQKNCHRTLANIQLKFLDRLRFSRGENVAISHKEMENLITTHMESRVR